MAVLDQGQAVAIASDNGIRLPSLAWDASRQEGVPYAVLCAFLEQESGGGRNVWGHDDTWMIGYPVLNADTYAVYKAHRDRFGKQGVGPMQLTSAGLQDEADDEGGCHKPWPNLVVGARFLARLKEQHGDWHAVALAYNGSESYADQMDQRIDKWRALLTGAAT